MQRSHSLHASLNHINNGANTLESIIIRPPLCQRGSVFTLFSSSVLCLFLKFFTTTLPWYLFFLPVFFEILAFDCSHSFMTSVSFIFSKLDSSYSFTATLLFILEFNDLDTAFAPRPEWFNFDLLTVISNFSAK